MGSKGARPLITFLAVVLLFVILQYNISMISSIKRRTVSTRRQDRVSRVPEPISSVRRLGPPPRQAAPAKEISCSRTHNTHYCKMSGPCVLDPTVSTFYLVNPTSSTPQKPLVEKIRGVTLVAGPASPKCDVNHESPAVVFNASFTGNFFHEFNDGFIPLYITVNTLFPDQDVVFVISKPSDWWLSKYKELLSAFSKSPIINLENDTSTHCFPSASVGMMTHGFMEIDPKSAPKKSLIDFHFFLDRAYDRKREFLNQNHPSIANPPKGRPRLVLFGRRGATGRLLLNQNEVRLEAERVGFEVIIFEPNHSTPLREAYALMNSSHAAVGIHGSALTHLLFLRPGSVLLQVVPLGLELLSGACFTTPANLMGLEYMEYTIKAEESSLLEKYDKDEMIIKDPAAFASKQQEKGIYPFRIYLREQDVKLDLVRFREHLKEVYVKAKKFMERGVEIR